MLSYKLYTFAAVAIGALTFGGCNIINPPEPIPAYIDLREPEVLITNPTTQGTASERITNTWVFLNNQPLGVYNRTGGIPVIGEGSQRIVCIAGIMENGVAATRVMYPFYTPDTTDAVLTPNGDIVIHPKYRYIAGTQFALNATFEIGSPFEAFGTSPAGLELSTQDVFEGARSALIQLNDSSYQYTGRSIQELVLPNDGRDIYLELNYRNDATIQVGLQETATGDITYRWNITPRLEWHKIYLNLRPAVLTANSTHFRLVFRTQLPSNMQSANVLLDNIKLVHF